MVGDTENCKHLTVFIPDTNDFYFSCKFSCCVQRRQPVKLPLWWDSTKCALNNPQVIFMVISSCFSDTALFLRIFQVGFNF